MLKKLSIFGIAAPALYLLHVVLGGMLWKGYSHMNQPISDLTASGAPNRGIILPITIVYGICLLIFSICVFSGLRELKYKTIKAGIIFFILLALTTLSYSFFPEDLPGSSLTFAGFMHLVVTGLTVPAAILSPLLIGLGLRGVKKLKGFSAYSIATAIVIFVTGGSSVVFIANKLPGFGLIERLNIGVLQLWVLIFALKLFNNKAEKLEDENKMGIGI